MMRVGACLSLTGRFAPFGTQAAHGLSTWCDMDAEVELVVEDDESSPDNVTACLPGLARRCDVLLGPYSTRLMRAAAAAAAGLDVLIWNHGGSGDDVETSSPGRVVSILTPTSRYAEPFLKRLASEGGRGALWLADGRGSFGRQVATGAERIASELGLRTRRIGVDEQLPADPGADEWDLLCAGLFEEDVARVEDAMSLQRPPRRIAAVAAGVQRFGETVSRHEGVFGIAQWFPSPHPAAVGLGPLEGDFLQAYVSRTGTVPDYPAVQAAAGAVVATHCARAAGTLDLAGLWQAATALDSSTLFGPFRIDPRTGAQRAHETVLVRWTPGGLISAS